MPKSKILVVDDEKNTRLTLEEALEPLGYDIVLAASGEEAIKRLEDPDLTLILLDLRMPGVSGLDVLRHIERERPDVRVVILTGHGTVDDAVESMKHGALDVIQKPFALEEIRALVQAELDPGQRQTARMRDYEGEVSDARNSIQEGDFDVALGHLRRARNRDPSRPEAFNLIGAVHELRHDRAEAQRHYRLALDLDPTYGPARENLEGSTRDPVRRGRVSLGEGLPETKPGREEEG